MIVPNDINEQTAAPAKPKHNKAQTVLSQGYTDPFIIYSFRNYNMHPF